MSRTRWTPAFAGVTGSRMIPVAALLLALLLAAAAHAEPLDHSDPGHPKPHRYYLQRADPAALESASSTDLATDEQSFGGTIGIRANFMIDPDGNLVEFQDWYREPHPLSLARLDLYKNFSTETALDLSIRNPWDQDLSFSLGLRTLPHFFTEHHFSDSTFYNLPMPLETQRQRFWGDFSLRKFSQVPLTLWYDVDALRGMGPERDRSYFDRKVGARAHVHTPGIDFDLDVPAYDFEDRHDPTNDTRTTGFGVTAARSFQDGDVDLIGSYRRTSAHLDTVDRTGTTDAYELRALLYEIFGVDGFKLEARSRWRQTPQDLQLTARTDELSNHRAVLSLTQNAGYSVQLGTELRELSRERLSRDGLDRLGLTATSTRADLAPFRILEDPRYEDIFARIALRWTPWFKATLFLKETDMTRQPRTDIVGFNSPSLFFDEQQERRLDVSFNPRLDMGANFRYREYQNKNKDRNYREEVRNQQGDLYWLLVNDRLTLGATFAYLTIDPSRGPVAEASTEAQTRGAYLSYRLSSELSVFSDFTQIDYTGAREAAERITNIGLEASNGREHKVSWRVAYTIDQHATDLGPTLDDFDVRFLNISGEAEF